MVLLVEDIVMTADADGQIEVSSPIEIDIVQAQIMASDYFASVTSTTGDIKFCIKYEVCEEDSVNSGTCGTSVNFLEDKVTITVDFSSEFTVTGVSTERTDAIESAKSASLLYTVFAKQCTEAGADYTGGALTQGSKLNTCVWTNATDVSVSDIDEMTLTGFITFSAVTTGGTVNALCEETCGPTSGENECMVSCMLISGFFPQTGIVDINVTGTAILSFDSARRLAGVQNQEPSLQEQPEVKPFEMIVPLAGAVADNEEQGQDYIQMIESSASIASSIVSLIVVAFSFFFM